MFGVSIRNPSEIHLVFSIHERVPGAPLFLALRKKIFMQPSFVSRPWGSGRDLIGRETGI